MVRGACFHLFNNYFYSSSTITVKSAILTIFCLVTSYSFAQNTLYESSWKKWKSSPEISIYYREHTNTKLIEIKAQASVNSTLSGFLLFIKDTHNIPNWLENAKSSRVIQEINDTTNIFNTQFFGFFLVKPRAMLIRSHYWQNDDLSIDIAVENAQQALAENDDHIVVDVVSAKWHITPRPMKKITIEYTFTVDAKGDVPYWLANHMSLKSTWQTLQNIQHQLPQSHWQQKSLKHINELSASQ